MRRVDDGRSLPRCLDTTPTRGRPPPPADDAAADGPPAALFTMRSGRHARKTHGQAAPGAPRVVPRGNGQLTQYCSVQYAIHAVRSPRAYATAPGATPLQCRASTARDRPVRCARAHGRRRRGAVAGWRLRKINCAHAPDVQSSRAVGGVRSLTVACSSTDHPLGDPYYTIPTTPIGGVQTKPNHLLSAMYGSLH
jgi:hypothetical protein